MIAAARALARRIRVGLLVRAKMLLQRAGVPGRADVFFACAWEWRYPPYLYLALREGQVLESARADLPFFLTYGSLRDFLFRVRGVPANGRPTAHTVVSAREDDLAGGGFRRRLRLSGDYFAENGDDGTLTVPYFCHPDFYRLRLHDRVPRMRGRRRTIRLFFAGTVDESRYHERFRFPIATRTEILRAVSSGLALDLTVVRTRRELASAVSSGPRRILFALSDDTDDTTDRHLMTPSEYLALMARSDFFLAPPGWVMPHCHNIIEAMSVGTIPVTNYGRYMTPPLQPDVDCIAFDTPEEAVQQLRRVLEMPPEQIARLRANVIRYHDQHLSAESFRRRLDAQPASDLTLRVNVEPGR